MEQLRRRYNIECLAKDDWPDKMYSYYVTGAGMFPYDMLRYDQAWPATSLDASILEAAHHGEKGRRSVAILSYHPPTIERWSSFLWSVGTDRMV